MAKLVVDGQASFEGGQDASLPPSRLPENKYQAGVNISTAKGILRPRYGYERKKLKFQEGGYVFKFNTVADFEGLFEQGKFQAMAPYRIGNHHYIVVVVSGVIFLINQTSYNVIVLTLGKDTQLNESTPRISWTIAGRFLVFFDFPSLPIIIEGQTARRSNPAIDELPTSNLGVYNQSRLFFSNAGNEFTAGDPVGNLLTPDAPITTEEITLIGSPFFGDVYQMPSQYDSPITAMATLQSTDKSTGIGQLITATKKEMFAFATNEGRDKWLSGQFGQMISDNAGIAGPRALVNVNSDLFFVSGDGQLRSLSMSVEEQHKWAKVPMNVEVANWVSYLSPQLIDFTTLGYFKNRIFWTVRPYRIPARRLDGTPILDVAHSGFVVLETDNVSRLAGDSPPSWCALWTGIRPMDMCVGDERMFVMTKEYYSHNALYEIDPELKFDKSDSGKRRQIKGTVYTREHFFQDMFAIKSLKTVELGITDIQGPFEVGVDWKPSHSSNFLFWSHFKHTVPVEYKDLPLNGEIPEKKSLAFRELKFGLPDAEQGHPVTKDLYDRVKRVQLRITLKGDSWQLNEYRLEANMVEENSTEFLPPNLPQTSEEKELYSDWTYEEFGL